MMRNDALEPWFIPMNNVIIAVFIGDSKYFYHAANLAV